MTFGFPDIPSVVIEYVRGVFAAANDKVSRAMDAHPSMHEESLDHLLIMELTAAPPAFFANERIGVAIESHWLGGRHMWRRWEIADIAFFVVLRRQGHLQMRKVALLQTKRLYSREVPVHELERADWEIGIGRIADRTDPSRPLSTQRRFTFDDTCVYGAMRAGDHQIEAIDNYFDDRGIPVYYGLYNPTSLPFSAQYPALAGAVPAAVNRVGCRVLKSDLVHGVLTSLTDGQAPTAGSLTVSLPIDPADAGSFRGWRLERFVADEVLRCREGRLFEDATDPNLRNLLYARSAPIQAAITITIDLGKEG
ncbi:MULTISPECIES: hypothetical protein [unclassified Mesorhizobium]|uniref:hypothetical protein n=1 Tax=unclassified Mesorhizobium TaxID=325217 RepID=UPI000BAE86E7|nr:MULTISPECIES: hypothetical protein [unclassified Mesorhizobium]PBB23276.1 hypothetical protein CK232_28625 [Mesorhizobium sp. WSM4304]PBB71846.1 hypothetical protein CK227_29905 [Mesorhizobium sp. WSM4308]